MNRRKLLSLADSRKLFVLEPGTGNVRTVRVAQPQEMDTQVLSGVAKYERVHLSKMCRAFFALYMTDKGPCVWLRDCEFSVWPGPFRTTLLRLPFARRFEVLMGPTSLFRCWYWTDVARIPDPGDMLSFLHENLRTRSSQEAFAAFWHSRGIPGHDVIGS